MRVLAGCPIAMSLLLVAVLDPVDKFWKSSPLNMISLKVYVDDFALSFRFNRNIHTIDLMRMRVANSYRMIEAAILGQGANFAKGKGKIITSDSKVGEAIAEELNNGSDIRRSITNETQITILGVDYAAGRPIITRK